MASLQQINEKGKETIVKTINRISLTIALLSGLSAIFYLFVQLYLPAILVSIVGFLFLVTYFLNKKEFHALARIISIVATNVGVLLFSSYLGFNSGFYLYLFASPQLIYLLFRIRQKKLIYFCIGINLLTFSSIFIIDAYNIVQSALIDLKILHLLYSLNFFFSIIICFVLIAIFARNNKIYIELLKDVNLQLENQQKKTYY
ncbi:MAG: hypothetical protein HYR91_02755 [Flavobacteriia bacterium]|nr:hypothetical protein [Flavobacteriia bacterium]